MMGLEENGSTIIILYSIFIFLISDVILLNLDMHSKIILKKKSGVK
jgi:hypothetical protein